MADIEEIEELKREIGFDKEGEHSIKDVKIIKDKKQYSLRIPKKYAEFLKINEETDVFRFHFIFDEETKNYRLEGELIKNEKKILQEN